MKPSRISEASKALRDLERNRKRQTTLALIRDVRKAGGHVPRKMELVLKGRDA
jgi:hypothetical protein